MSNFDQIGKLLCVILLIFQVRAPTPRPFLDGRSECRERTTCVTRSAVTPQAPKSQAGESKRVEDATAAFAAET
jgi:hypothetical protein